jgi:hypothetical protein
MCGLGFSSVATPVKRYDYWWPGENVNFPSAAFLQLSCLYSVKKLSEKLKMRTKFTDLGPTSWVIWRTPVTVESKGSFLNGFVFEG